MSGDSTEDAVLTIFMSAATRGILAPQMEVVEDVTGEDNGGVVLAVDAGLADGEFYVDGITSEDVGAALIERLKQLVARPSVG